MRSQNDYTPEQEDMIQKFLTEDWEASCAEKAEERWLLAEQFTAEVVDNDLMYVCDLCGAWAATPQQIVHHRNCRENRNKYWQDYYSQIDNQNNN